LLFKLEFDLQIKDLGVTLPVPSSPLYSTEPPVSKFAKKVFTFADDCNVLCKLDEESLARVKTVLEDFATISGLECNLEKTNVLVIGEEIEDVNVITDHGFVQKNCLKILGMSVSNNLDDDIRDGAGHIRRKIVEKITTWQRFNLSLPGRIQIAKTMLYSQVNYLGCFLPFSPESMADWETLISQFVAGNIRIGIQRIFSPVEIGGLGLFRICKFLDAQKIRWIVYSIKSIDADWKLSLHKSSIQSVFRTDKAYLDELSPIIITIANAFVNFKKKFFDMGNNYKKIQIFGEFLFTVSPRSGDFFNLDDINSITNLEIRNKITKITVSDMFVGNTIMGLNDFEHFLGGPVPVPVFRKLVKIVQLTTTRYKKNIETQGISIPTFLSGWKRGSKKFRKILLNEGDWYVPHNIIKFAANVETVITVNCAPSLNTNWCKSYYSNELRTFIFKLHNNTLPVNTMVSHFARGISRNCVFCEISRNPEPVDETVFHLFFDCTTTEALRLNFFKWLTENESFELHRHEFFCCGPGELRCEIWTSIVYLFLFYVWECKLRKSLPEQNRLRRFILEEMNTVTKTCNRMANKKENCGINLNLERLQG
jgi:hypothetical protein